MDVSEQVHRIYTEGRDIAACSGKPFCSVHLLLAMFTESATPNQAQAVLQSRGVDEDRILETLRGLDLESGSVLEAIRQKTEATAKSCRSPMVGSLHLLLAFLQVSNSLAYRVLERAAVDIGALRATVLSYLTGSLPRSLVENAISTLGAGDEAESSRPGPAMAPPGGAGEGAGQGAPPRSASSTAATRAWLAATLADLAAARTRGDRESTTSAALLEASVDPDEDAADADDGASEAPLPPARDRAVRPALRLVPPVAATPAAGRGAAPGRKLLPPFALDPEEYPLLTSLGRNLSRAALQGELDPLIGREREVEQVLDVLGKRRTNNPCILGEPGVGKTAVVEGVAAALTRTNRGPADERVIVALDVTNLVAGTGVRGAFSERMAGLRAEVRKAAGRVIVFIDEFHTIIGAGATTGAHDAASDLKAALARGEFPCIGATTLQEYRRHIENDPALERRFQPIIVDEPSEETTRAILGGLVERYARHHGVRYEADALEAAVTLSRRYIHDRRLPDKAINLLDLAGARAARAGRRAVRREEVAEVVSQQVDVPVDKILVRNNERLLHMRRHLSARIIGHAAVLDTLCAVIQRNWAGFRSRRPVGSFLLLGPTGVGKTETVRALAEFLFDDPESITRLDMSEYMEPHSVSRLIGASPGYVGYEEGGQLTGALFRRPYQIVLLDEVEKAAPEVLNLLLQVLEEGNLTDGKGRRVDFSNALIVLTSNLGSGLFSRAQRPVGFSGAAGPDPAATAEAVLREARRHFPPELWNRIDEKLVYTPLSEEDVRAVGRLLLRVSSDRLYAERGVRFVADDAVVEHLLRAGGFDPELGARPMRRVVQSQVEAAVARALLAHELPRDTVLTVRVAGDSLVCLPGPEVAAQGVPALTENSA